MSSSAKKIAVAVTGANGFLASHIVDELLRRGYRVHGTVRSVSDESKVGHLRALRHASKRLKLFEADLTDNDAFSEAFEGCKYVIHTASPFTFKHKDPQRDLVDPAVHGSLEAMRAAQKCGVTKIVVTSSMVAVTDEPTKVYTEADWNEKSSLKRNPYGYSKVQAEKACWDFVQQNPKNCPELVTVLPGCICGPSLGNAGLVNPINDIFRQLLDGEQPAIIKFGMPYVDVRDVALAHVAAMENDKASGRYLCAGEAIWSMEMADLLRKRFPKAKVPGMEMTGAIMTSIMRGVFRLSSDPQMNYISYQLGNLSQFDNSRVQNELGIQFRDVRPGWWDVIDQMAAAGLIKNVQSAN